MLGSLPKHLLPCAVTEPSATLGSPILHSPDRDEDRDRQGSRAASRRRLPRRKIPVSGRCHFPANTRQDSCVEEGGMCLLGFMEQRGFSMALSDTQGVINC